VTPDELAHLRHWIGRTTRDTDVAALRHARLMAAAVDRPGPPLAVGDPLPALWHWLYFLDARPPGELGRDGHPARGGFLPPVPLPHRMWAGGALGFDAPLPLGARVEKRSTVQAVEHKTGRSGELVFVTVVHEVFAGGRRCVRETQDLVYKAATPASAAAPIPEPTPAPGDAVHTRAWTPDATELFRYSALTFNGHRIHYDVDYCRQVEGYADLVVHGPLIATRLAALAVEALGAPLLRFRYRALRPVLRGQTVTLAVQRPGATDGATDGATASGAAPQALVTQGVPVVPVASVGLTATLPDGRVAMQAQAQA
jgi:3-methylfumaryl-CoA hydratase